MMAISQTTLFVQFYLFGLFVNRTELLERCLMRDLAWFIAACSRRTCW